MTREEAIKIIKSNCSCTGSKLREACAMFIPELAESKDERITNCIEELLRKAPQSYFVDMGMTFVECFAYLEKQKEQNVVSSRETILGIWKPSEKQMEALFLVSGVGAPKHRETLKSLYNDLKKL